MKELLNNISNDINNMRDCLVRQWEDLVANGSLNIDELFDILKDIEYNLPCQDTYIVDTMLGDREHNSTLMCSHYIEDLLDFEEVDKPSKLPVDFQKEVWTILESGYGSCKIDW